MRVAPKVTLTDEQRATLRRWARGRTTPMRLVRRAQIVLLAAKGTQNMHAVALRPSSLVALNKADLFLQIGLSLEHSYVPGMLMKARNSRIQPGAAGFVNCSVGWEAIDVPERLTQLIREERPLPPAPKPQLRPEPSETQPQQVVDTLQYIHELIK